MKKQSSFICIVVAIAVGYSTAGCQPAIQSSNPKANPVSAVEKKSGKQNSHEGHSHGHGHGTGPHGGTVADWGGGKYHVEFNVDHDKKEATVYVLGSDEKSPAPIKADKILLSIKNPTFQVELTPLPLDGETNGVASRFVGKHDSLGVVQEFAGALIGEVEGTPYTGEFAEEAHEDKVK